jgi:hypothetical protein
VNTTTKLVLVLSLFAMSGLTPSAFADTMSLYNWGVNVDSALYDKANTPPLPSGPGVYIEGGGFNFTEGLGTLTIVAAGPGTHYVDVYFDHDLNPAQYANDQSAAVGTPASGESWEIGTGAEAGGTQLYTDFTNNDYDDTNNAPGPADVATGLEFAFTTTDADPFGVVTVNISEVAPSSGFYLEQFDTYSGTSPSEIYISGSEVNTAPEPASWLLVFPPGAFFLRQWCKRMQRPE